MERVCRKGDERLYQPKVHSDRIRALYKLKQLTGKPMTVLLDEAIKAYAERTNEEATRQEPKPLGDIPASLPPTPS